MSFDEFLAADPDTAALPPALAALALDHAGRWDAAHDCAAAQETAATNRVHAYLHRKEGDVANAGYWYARVGEAMPATDLDDEWRELVERFL